MKDSYRAKRLEINGVVQGVGFRPFLFQLAHNHSLFGEVSNTSNGVTLTVEGKFSDIEAFINDIQTKKPILSSITDIKFQEIPESGFQSFTIQKSKPGNNRSTLISPDVSICKDCLDELNDPGDRRYEYPFINCTNCGPRFTIIEDIPYDRPKTSMKHFPMCEDCQKEYYNPLDRRFHAQPNACSVCGPHVTLVNSLSENICSENENSIEKAAMLLKQGKILAIKGLGGFHLAVDASNNDAVEKLRKRKKRPDKPFALMAQSVTAIEKFVTVNKVEKKLLESFNRPILLLAKLHQNKISNSLAQGIAPLNNYLGIMLPYTPLHYILLKKGPPILVMTSGNRSDEPLSIDNDDAIDAFGHIADYFLIHNRDIYFRADDSIIQVKNNKPRFLRRSRGYAPLPISLIKSFPKVLATGGGLKSTVCLTRKDQAFLSQYIGDLNNFKTFDYYKNSIEHLKRIMDIEPEIIAHDMHPGYMSTDYAKGFDKKVKTTAVQHHHAHAVSCMAENKIDHEVIALTLDGTGYGTDGKIWGGEILTCDYTSFKRKVHLEYIPMPGSEAAVLEPWRMAVAYLDIAFGDNLFDLDIALTRDHKKEKLEFLQKMMQKGLNSPLTSSAGRLFDGVSSILGIRHKISFESQAAMELEAISKKDLDCKAYSFYFKENINNKTFEIKLAPLIKEIVHDINIGKHLPDISTRFHKTFVDIFVQGVLKVRQNTGLKDVVLSGGVFNNKLVFDNILKELENNGLKVYTHTKVPAGDGGISLGQAVIAGAKEQEEKSGIKG